ncbi:hypothetical protein Avbf_13113, partial [Armadillidium vulgare]
WSECQKLEESKLPISKVSDKIKEKLIVDFLNNKDKGHKMMKQLWLVFLLLLSCFSLSNQLDLNKRFPSPYGEKEKESKFWYSKAEEELKTALSRRFNTKTAKNVIIFLGDGMGVTVSTVGRIYKGQKKGFSGAEEYLAWEKFPDVSLIK